MITWNNLDTLASFKELEKVERVNLVEAMTGESGAERVKNYSVPMAEGLTYNYAAKQVDDKVLAALAKLADEAQLAEKFEALYNGEVIDVYKRQNLDVQVNADGMQKMLSGLSEGYQEYVKSHPEADYSNLGNQIAEYLTSDQAKTIIQKYLKDILKNNGEWVNMPRQQVGYCL